MFDVTSGKPGICIKHALRLDELQGSRGDERVRIYQFLTIGLVYAVLHRFVDEFGIGRGGGEGGGEDGESLQVKYL